MVSCVGKLVEPEWHGSNARDGAGIISGMKCELFVVPISGRCAYVPKEDTPEGDEQSDTNSWPGPLSIVVFVERSIVPHHALPGTSSGFLRANLPGIVLVCPVFHVRGECSRGARLALSQERSSPLYLATR